MLSYTRGILVAYKDVLKMIEKLDSYPDDEKIEELKAHIIDRIENYIDRQGAIKDIE